MDLLTSLAQMQSSSWLELSLRFTILALSVWRVSSLLVNELGPGRLFLKLRELTGIEHTDDGHILSYGDWTPLYCIRCTSLWVAIVMMCLPLWIQVPLAVSAGAILINGLVDSR